jgi:hypothetical protein
MRREHLPEDRLDRRCLQEGGVVLEAVVQVGAETREERRVMREAVTRGGEVVQVVQRAE